MTLADDARNAVKRGLAGAGLEVRRVKPWEPQARRVTLATRFGVRTVLDVGAGRGDWAAALRAAGYRGTIVSFEPLAAAYEELRRAAEHDPSWYALKVALGAMRERRGMAPPGAGYEGREEIQVVPLDEVCRDRLTAHARVSLRVDVQGSEVDILRGAHATLPQVDVLELELSATDMHDGKRSYQEMLNFGEALGMDIAGLLETSFDEDAGRLLQFDALFARRADHPNGAAPDTGESA